MTTLDSTISSSSISPRRASVIERRWNELFPFIRMRIGPLADLIPERDRHFNLVSSLLLKGIEMRTIRRLSLDDIRFSDEELGVRSERYLERHNRRKNNVTNSA